MTRCITDGMQTSYVSKRENHSSYPAFKRKELRQEPNEALDEDESAKHTHAKFDENSWTGMNQRNGRVLRRYEIHIRDDPGSVSRQQRRLQQRDALGAHVCGMGERAMSALRYFLNGRLYVSFV